MIKVKNSFYERVFFEHSRVIFTDNSEDYISEYNIAMMKVVAFQFSLYLQGTLTSPSI